MNRRSVQSVCLLAATVAMLAWPRASHAQDQPPPAPAPHQHEAPADPHAGHVMAGSLFTRRDNAGTAWTPATTPMLAAHRQAGPWSLMLMGNGFVQYLEEFAPIHRGGRQAGSINWLMGMGRRPLGAGVVGRPRDAERRALHHRWLRLPEPAGQRRTVRRRRHPRQAAPARPGDGAGGRIQPPGHALPALARLRRPCRRARPRPGGVSAPRLRHGQSDRADFAPLARRDAHHLRRRDQRALRRPLAGRGIGLQRPRARRGAARLRLRPLDSFSARLQLAPTDGLALQVSAGRLESAEAGEGGLPPRDVTRITASMQHQGTLAGRPVATTVAWGGNPRCRRRTHAVLAEGVLTMTARHTLFARAEIAGKRGHDLHIHEDVLAIFTVGKLQGGYLRLFAPRRGMQAGLGGSASAAIRAGGNPAQLRRRRPGHRRVRDVAPGGPITEPAVESSPAVYSPGRDYTIRITR